MLVGGSILRRGVDGKPVGGWIELTFHTLMFSYHKISISSQFQSILTW